MPAPISRFGAASVEARSGARRQPNNQTRGRHTLRAGNLCPVKSQPFFTLLDGGGTNFASARLALQVATAIGPAERWAKECSNVLNLALAAAALFAAAESATVANPKSPTTAASGAASGEASPSLMSHSPWWETVTVTIAGDGQPRGCEYRTSLQPDASKACDVVGSAAGMSPAGASKEQITRLTFERRFRPAVGGLAEDKLPTGDTLLGSQVLALAIDASGAVAGCKIVAATGDLTPDYGCKEAASEQFDAAAVDAPGGTRTGYMSILVYGHSEELV